MNISSTFSSPSGSHTILVFPHQTLWQHSDGDSPNGCVECRWGRQKLRFSTNIWLSDRWLLQCEQQRRRRPCSLSHRPPRISDLVYHNQHGRPRRREQNIMWIVRSGKSEADLALDVLHYWSYWQARRIARPLCDSRATCWYVYHLLRCLFIIQVYLIWLRLCHTSRDNTPSGSAKSPHASMTPSCFTRTGRRVLNEYKSIWQPSSSFHFSASNCTTRGSEQQLTD